MDTTLSDPMVGRLLEGRYAVESLLAHGGMASVYLATDTRLERRVAVKVIHAHLCDDAETIARFEREARAAARLSHPDVVAVYDQGTDSGRPFLVMEYVPGATLRQVLRDRGRLSAAESLAVMDRVLAALSAAHSAGLVHRDVKPENVLVTADGRVKVADFGLARAVAGSTVTTTGSVLMGTAAYLAPEQFEYGTADARSDVYSAGILLFELLTGTTPFQADSTYALLSRHAREDIPAPSTRASGIAPQVDALVTWAASRDPQQRPRDAGELHASLIDVRDRLGLHGAVPTLPVSLTTRLAEQTAAMARVSLTRTALPGADAAATTVAAAAAPPGTTRPPAGRAPDPRPRPRKSRRRGWIIAAIVALVVALAGVAGWWFADGRYTHAPQVVGLTRSAADAKLSAAGLHARYLTSVYSLTVKKGLVAVETNDGRVTHGSTVDLRLSRGPRTHPLPSVANDSVAAATAQLDGLNLKVSGTVKHVYSSLVDQGLVVGTEPAQGTVVKEGSTVTLEVSRGVQQVTVPMVDGESQAVATAALDHAGFTVTPQQRYSSVTAGDVITSHPTQGRKIDAGSTVTIVVSQGPRLYNVPDEEGQSIDAAIHAIRQAGFIPDPKEVLPGGPGVVLNEKLANTQQPHGTTIQLDYY
jgi:serine/threonine-protein kinase